MPTLHIAPDDVRIVLEEDETVLSASRRAGVPHAQLCGGQGRCSTCRVVVTEGLGACAPRTSIEAGLASRLGFPDAMRLACQLRVHGDVGLRRLVLDADDLLLASQLAPDSAGAKVGEERPYAILFTDLRGFTSFSEHRPPFDVMHVLGRHFLAMGRVVRAHRGVVNNTMGDGMLVLFDGTDPVDACGRGVRAALDMLRAQDRLGARLEALYGQRLDMGIGLHFGEVVVGVLRCGDEMRTTVIGDAVNLASRIEEANKTIGTRLLVSETVLAILAGSVRAGRAAEIPLKGKSGTFRLHEILAIDEAEPAPSEPAQTESASISGQRSGSTGAPRR